MTPRSTTGTHTRRDALRLLLGGIGAGVGIGVLSSCTSTAGDQIVVLDSYYGSGDGRQAVLDALAQTPIAANVQVGTTNRETFTASIDGYLASQPGTVFTWAAGHELASLIREGGISEVSSVWRSTDLNPRLRRVASDSSGVPYLVPLWYDPWALFYSRTSWVDSGYSEPDSIEGLVELSRRMASDGISAFGLSRLATPALLTLYDYINVGLHGVVAQRGPIVDPSYDVGPESEAVFGVVRSLAEVEAGLGDAAPVSIVPALLSEAATRSGPEEDLGCFVPTPSAVVAEVEGFLLADAGEGVDTSPAHELLGHLASIGPQEAFLGGESAILPANLNANYQAMNLNMLKMVEVIEGAQTIVESIADASTEKTNLVLSQLTEIVRPS